MKNLSQSEHKNMSTIWREIKAIAKRCLPFQNYKESKTVFKGNTVNINISFIGNSKSTTEGDKS